ncbi:hypothetical protein G9P44_004254 [Scheffersomyces stipitis]|nr:hypothetical protein G9P44_004254 [Scheffersomyces stipitis]
MSYTPSDDLGLALDEFNSKSLENLLQVLAKIYTSNNLLVLDQSLSPFLNSLTTFSKLKEQGKFSNIIWLNNELLSHDLDVFRKFAGLIILVQETEDNRSLIEQLLVSNLAVLDKIHGLKVNIIVKDLSRSYLYELNKSFGGNVVNFDSILSHDLKSKPVTSISPRIKVLNWETLPVYNDDIIVVDVGKYGGIDSYFDEPLKQVNQLVEALVQILFASHGSKNNVLKLRNIYGKGNHADFLVQLLQDVKIPEYLNTNLNQLEIEFYRTKLLSNTDLVVLERNLDFYSVLFNQLNYQGLIDDLFELKFNTITNPVGDSSAYSNLSNDVLYSDSLRHLNFASIGPELNKLAKEIQQQFKLKDTENDTLNSNLQDIRKIVQNLGTLTQQQDLIKKHTSISESILERINSEYETFLTFQNDIFEMDYKLQLSKLKYFFNINFNQYIILTTIVLVSITNNGIKERDFDWISQEVLDSYGISTSLALEKLVEYKMIRINVDYGNDFLSTITGGLASNQQTTPVPDENQSLANLGITGAQDTYRANFTLIDKFWNLHPLEEEEEKGEEPVQHPDSKDLLVDLYPNPSFTLPSNTVPLLTRLLEALYLRDFLKYKPVNNIKKRPNWDNLSTSTMFNGKTVDINIDDTSDVRTTKPSPLATHQEYIVVVVIGGITRSEISCLKYLQQRLVKNKKNKKIVVVSSGIVNNRKLLDFFLD